MLDDVAVFHDEEGVFDVGHVFEGISVHGDEIGRLARLDGADLISDAHCLRPAERGQSQRSERGRRRDVAGYRFGDQRGGAHLVEHVEAVVRRRPVRAEPNPDARGLQRGRPGRSGSS